MVSNQRVWVFNGERARFPAAVFTNRESAERWISDNALSGVLTAYPLDRSAYDWAVGEGYFTPNKPASAEFVAGFTSAHQEHYHYVEGAREHKDQDQLNISKDKVP